MPAITFVSWKDIKNPFAGGAEVVHQELSKRFVADGFKVIHLVPGFKNCLPAETVDGVEIIRVGNSLFNFYYLPFYFAKHLREQTDILIDVFNCFASFTFLFSKFKTQNIFLIHHIQGKVWFYQANYFISVLGFLVEKIQLIILSQLFRGKKITVSNSTKLELKQHFFDINKIGLISEGTDIEHVADLQNIQKNTNFSVVFIGRLEKMKRPLDAVVAFNIFNKKYPETEMFVAGTGFFEQEIKDFISANNLSDRVKLLGRVSHNEKIELLQKTQVILVTSVKEGWGLVVTEANAQGTPAITYDTDGLRDSNTCGIITKENTPEEIAKQLEKIYLDQDLYKKLQLNSWKDSFKYTFDQSYLDIKSFLN